MNACNIKAEAGIATVLIRLGRKPGQIRMHATLAPLVGGNLVFEIK